MLNIYNIILYKLPQTNTNRLHLACYSVGGNQKKFYSHHKNDNDNNEKRKNPHLQIEILEKKQCKNRK